MATDAITYSWHGASKKAPTLMSALCLVASIYMACMAIFRPHHLSMGRATIMAILSSLFFAAAVSLQSDRLITIDLGTGSVYRSTSFWGLSLWKSQWRLTDFTGVSVYRLKAGPPQSMDLVHVGLRRISGGTLAIRYFQTGHGQPCLAADEFANELQRVVGGTVVA